MSPRQTSPTQQGRILAGSCILLQAPGVFQAAADAEAARRALDTWETAPGQAALRDVFKEVCTSEEGTLAWNRDEVRRFVYGSMARHGVRPPTWPDGTWFKLYNECGLEQLPALTFEEAGKLLWRVYEQIVSEGQAVTGNVSHDSREGGPAKSFVFTGNILDTTQPSTLAVETQRLDTSSTHVRTNSVQTVLVSPVVTPAAMERAEIQVTTAPEVTSSDDEAGAPLRRELTASQWKANPWKLGPWEASQDHGPGGNTIQITPAQGLGALEGIEEGLKREASSNVSVDFVAKVEELSELVEANGIATGSKEDCQIRTMDFAPEEQLKMERERRQELEAEVWRLRRLLAGSAIQLHQHISEESHEEPEVT